MGKRSKKCGGNGELEARRSGISVVFGRRCRERRREAVRKEERQISHRQLRKRRFGIQTPNNETVPGNLGGGQYKSSPGLGRISACSSDIFSEASTTPSRSSELQRQRRDAALLFRLNCERKEKMASTHDSHRDEASDVESTVEMEPCRRPSVAATPPEAELEAFFETAERELRQRFAERYNFDLINDVPMAGRYEWIPVIP